MHRVLKFTTKSIQILQRLPNVFIQKTEEMFR